MFRSLRSRQILSHVLPLLVIIPIVGIALIYALETGIILHDLSADLKGMGDVLVRLSATQPDIWRDPVAGATFARQAAQLVDARVLLLDPQGRLWASSEPIDRAILGQRLPALTSGTLARIGAGQPDQATVYSVRQDAELVAVTVPAVGPGGQVTGAIRLTRQLAAVYGRFLRLRYLIGAILLAGLIFGTGIGWSLALNLEAPLKLLTDAVAGLAKGKEWTPVPESGPREVRLLVRTVNQLVSQSSALESSRRQLLANLVHELGRPLGSLSLAVQALQRGAAEDAQLREDLLVGIGGETDRLKRLLDDLDRLYDQVAGTLQVNTRPMPLRTWLLEVLPVWHAVAEAKSLSFEGRVPQTLPVVMIDPDRLGQALGNLLSNAIKYTPPGGRICVEAGQADAAVWIRVSDSGPGIPLVEQLRVFEPFQRGTAAKHFPPGMGLGLTIARDLVVAHGGRIELESLPGQDTRFTLWLPLAALQVMPQQLLEV